MRKALSAILLVAAISTSGCAAFRSRNTTPDEFAVARNAPLIIPPDYGLAPPVAGTAALSPEGAQQQAVDAIFGGPAPRSQTESLMLDRAGRDRAQVGVRSTVGDPDTRLVDKGQTTLAILSAQDQDSTVASAQVPQ